jgi:cyclic-di-GMP phosphodiesterase TipF (flagellum assembly factor)
VIDPAAATLDPGALPPNRPPAAELVAAAAAPASPPAVAPGRNSAELLAAVRSAIEANRFDVYLQPMVTLPQRKVRFYELVTRLRDDHDRTIGADEFLAVADPAGLTGQIDHAVLLRAIQVVRRLLVRNKELGVFVNIAAATLSDTAAFAQCLDFLEANRALASSVILEFKQSTLRQLGPVEAENLAALAQRGYRFSIDHVTDLRFEPRDLADRGVRFIKVPAALLLAPHDQTAADIHPADRADLLGRFGIDLVAERIEGERAVVDLLDYDVRFGQGFLFAAPRPLRPETTTAAAPASPGPAQQDTRPPHDSSQPLPGQVQGDLARIAPVRASGNAALVRRVAGPL